MSGRVLVIGAINTDLVVEVARLPSAGETVLGGDLRRHHGGKGANQAVAASRAGASVLMLGAVGADQEASAALDDLAGEAVDTSFVARLAGGTGVALIAVAPDGGNQIVVSPGANGLLSAAHVREALERIAPTPEDVLLASLEVPMEAVGAAVTAAAAAGCLIIVNPAPAVPLPAEILRTGPILTPNLAELRLLAGVAEPEVAARSLLSDGAGSVLVTLGDDGSTLFGPHQRLTLPAHAVNQVVDTTGAGDAFNGALAAWLAWGQSLPDAARVANVAGALAVTAQGARGGVPTRERLLAETRMD